MATTANKIEKALAILNSHDWYWMMSESSSAYHSACGSMRAFVELVATIENSSIVKALRDLWTATYNYVQATMWGSNKAAKAEFESIKSNLMAVIMPINQMAA